MADATQYLRYATLEERATRKRSMPSRLNANTAIAVRVYPNPQSSNFKYGNRLLLISKNRTHILFDFC